MILRISVSDPTAQCVLSVKFGVEPGEAAEELLRVAKELGVKVVGIRLARRVHPAVLAYRPNVVLQLPCRQWLSRSARV